jgi:hypothetical protein
MIAILYSSGGAATMEERDEELLELDNMVEQHV